MKATKNNHINQCSQIRIVLFMVLFFFCMPFICFGQLDLPAPFDSLQAKIGANLRGGSVELREYSRQFDSISNEQSNPLIRGLGKYFVGISQHYNGENIQAIESYLKAIPYFEDAKATKYLGRAYANLCGVYVLRQDLEKAFPFCEKSLEAYQAINDSIGIGAVLNNMAAQAQSLNNIKKADSLFSRAKNYYNPIRDRTNYSSVIANICGVKYQLGQLAEAEKFGLQYLNEFEQQDNLRAASHVYTILGLVYSARGNLNKARFYAKKGLKYKLASNELNMLPDSYELLSGIEEKSGNHELALKYYKQMTAISDSTWKREKENRITKLLAEFDIAEKEKAINELNASKKIQDLSLKNSRNRTRIFGMAIIASLLLLGGLLYSLNQRRLSNDQLREKNELIEDSLSEKQSLLNEIHHRVKNNLQVVSSLLSLQSSHLKDAKAVDALKDGKQRIEAMALIHQKLYRQDNVTGVQLKEYIPRLCENIFNAYNIRGKDITFRTNVEPAILDVSKVVPLGLVLNELVSNCLEHAFPNSKGSIDVSISKEGNNLVLKVIDDGIGFDPADKSIQNFGSSLIDSFVQKLNGKIKQIANSGTTTIIEFPQ